MRPLASFLVRKPELAIAIVALFIFIVLGLTLSTSSPSQAQGPFTCDAVTDVPVEECQALQLLYENADGRNWQEHSDWMVANTVCTWFGVTCNSGQVIELSLAGNQLNGEIPLELGNLTALEKLRLDNNVLSGTIPPELGGLHDLEDLRLDKISFLAPSRPNSARCPISLRCGWPRTVCPGQSR